jgi:asparagine synthase (glutamine-hydrolysing)
MCGIIGIASSRNITDKSWLAAGIDSMRHRGPDDVGEWWEPEGRVGLAHCRLAIIDLSDAGHQPMFDLTGELCIVFNGEIYNFIDLRTQLIKKGYSFRSNSDTEVILAAYREWNTECMSRLNGMFAFALYDLPYRRLFIARDRAGEKPLFYSLENGVLTFSSELKGLMANPAASRRIDPEALDCYLSEGYVQGDRCILKGMKKLPPAHALTFDLNKAQLSVWRYWQLPALDPSAASTVVRQNDLIDELETLFEDSVRRQLVADVPVGVLLSGGIDSSLLTAMAVRANSNVKTFTVCFPGYGKYDETEHARLIARHFGTEHLEIEAESVSIDLLPKLARQFDESIIDSSMIPTYLVSKLIRQHCTVALGGDGGDELFGGYRHYNRLLFLKKYFGFLPYWLRSAIAKGAEVILPVGFKGRNWLQALMSDFNDDLPLIANYYDPHIRRRLTAKDYKRAEVSEQLRNSRIPKTIDLLQRATRMDFTNYLAEDLLVKVDRASMLNSLEVRAPMLDYRLIEFAFGKVPSYLKAISANRKILLKSLADRILPPEFDQDRKQGFSIPLGAWLTAGPWLNFFREVLLDTRQALFDHRVIEGLFDGQSKGRSNGERLFGLVMFELWRQEYRIEL